MSFSTPSLSLWKCVVTCAQALFGLNERRISSAEPRSYASMNWMHLGELGIIVPAPDVGRLAADEPAGRIRIDPIGRVHQLADQVRPDRILIAEAIQQRGEIELAERLIQLIQHEVGRDKHGLGRAAAIVVRLQPALIGRIVVVQPPGEGGDEGAPGDLVIEGVGDAHRALAQPGDVVRNPVAELAPQFRVDGPRAVGPVTDRARVALVGQEV